jgi:hypothetical protein
VEPENIYNMDEKEFLMGITGRSIRLSYAPVELNPIPKSAKIEKTRFLHSTGSTTTSFAPISIVFADLKSPHSWLSNA